MTAGHCIERVTDDNIPADSPSFMGSKSSGILNFKEGLSQKHNGMQDVALQTFYTDPDKQGKRIFESVTMGIIGAEQVPPRIILPKESIDEHLNRVINAGGGKRERTRFRPDVPRGGWTIFAELCIAPYVLTKEREVENQGLHDKIGRAHV